MSKIDIIIAEDLEPKLNSITVANGFENDVSVLDGFMIHYVNDLLNGVRNMKFPCIAFQPVKDSVKTNSAGDLGDVVREIRIIGAVDATDRKTVNAKLNSLIFDIRRALVMDTNRNKSKAKNFVIGDCDYGLPDSKDQYAFIETSVFIYYTENWKK